MQIDILTLFPSMFLPLSESIIGKAKEKGLIDLKIHNIRDHSKDKHKTVDDTPYGGGAGMVLKAEVLADALRSLKKKNSKVILMSPGGKKFCQDQAKRLSKEKGLTIICGRYEGIDDRIREMFIDEEISIGDYVLTGGELPAMVIIDSICRHIPGVLGNESSSASDSFSDGLLEGPHYTKPEKIDDLKVPNVLLSGNHKEIDKWRKKESLRKTLMNRPDLFSNINITENDKQMLNEILIGE